MFSIQNQWYWLAWCSANLEGKSTQTNKNIVWSIKSGKDHSKLKRNSQSIKLAHMAKQNEVPD